MYQIDWKNPRTKIIVGSVASFISVLAVQTLEYSSDLGLLLGFLSPVGFIIFIIGMIGYLKEKKELKQKFIPDVQFEVSPLVKEYNVRASQSAGTLIFWFFLTLTSGFLFDTDPSTPVYFLAMIIWLGIPINFLFGILARLNLNKNPKLALKLIKIPGYYFLFFLSYIFLLAFVGIFF